MQKSIKFPDSSDSVETSSIRLKGGLFPLTLLEISRFQQAEFEAELQIKAEQAPAFFNNTPVVLSLDESADTVISENLVDIVSICRKYGLLPVAVRTATPETIQSANQQGLAIMPLGRVKPVETAAPVAEEAKPEQAPETLVEQAAPVPSAESAYRSSKIITTPIRSGQQVYAQGGDLIVMAQVSAGAEILADGNIHIYGPLRGRALAGVMGNTEARIFCQSLEAELISIAGIFKLDEDLRGPNWKQAIKASLSEQALTVELLN